MEIEDFFLRDDMHVSGSSTASLLRISKIIDDNTVVEPLEFNDCKILHFFDIQNTTMIMAMIKLGEQIRVTSKGKLLGINDKTTLILGPKVASMDMTGMLNSNCYCLEEEMITTPEVNGTIFLFDADKKKPVLLFTSAIAAKTMGQRLSMRTVESSLERDIFLAKELGDMTTALKLYTTMRGIGKYRKAIGVFANDPERIPFSEVAEAMIEYKSGKAIHWCFTQRKGMEAFFEYPEKSKMFEDKYHLPYKPMVMVQICDSGHFSNHFYAGWFDPNDSEHAYFVTHEIAYEDNNYGIKNICSLAIDECFKLLEKDAEKMVTWQNQIECETMEDYTKLVETFTNAANVLSAGVKVKKLFIKYALDRYKNELNYLYLLRLLVSSLNSDCNVSEYSDSKLRFTAFPSLFKNSQNVG